MSQAGWHSHGLWAWHHASPCAFFFPPDALARGISQLRVSLGGPGSYASVRCMWRYQNPKLFQTRLGPCEPSPRARGRIQARSWRKAKRRPECCPCRGQRSGTQPGLQLNSCEVNSWLLLHNKNRKRSIMCHDVGADNSDAMYTMLLQDRGQHSGYCECDTTCGKLWLDTNKYVPITRHHENLK